MTVCRRAAGDLDGLDALETDALVLPLFAGRAQPLGVAGYVDWRLSGRLARLVRDERFTGAPGESLLTLALGRIGVARVFLLGLGDPRAPAEVDLAPAVRVLGDASVRTLAFGPPAPPEGADAGWSGALCARWIAACGGAFDEVLVLDADGALADADAHLSAAAARAGARWEA